MIIQYDDNSHDVGLFFPMLTYRVSIFYGIMLSSLLTVSILLNKDIHQFLRSQEFFSADERSPLRR